MKKTLLFISSLFISLPFIQSQILPQPCEIQADMSVAICFDPPGCVVFEPEVENSTGSLSYLWNNGSTEDDIIYGGASYQGTCEIVTITDSKGCIAITGADHANYGGEPFVLMPDTFKILGVPTVVDVSLNDQFDSSIYLLVQPPYYGDVVLNEDGTANYTPDPSWCGPDYFRYVLQDTNYCNFSEIVTVTLFNGPCAGILISGIDCNNDCGAKAEFYHQDIFTPPLTYTWSNGSVEDNAQNLCAGQISLTVTDALGASETYQEDISEGSISAGIDAIDQTCRYSKIHLSPIFSVNPPSQLDFEWSGYGVYPLLKFDTAQAVNTWHEDSLHQYQLILRAENGCVDTAYHIVDVLPSPWVASITEEKVYCPGDTLRLRSTIKDGTPPYKYYWSGPLGVQAGTPDLEWPGVTGLHTGHYRLTVSDVNGCTGKKLEVVSIPDSLDLIVTAYSNNYGDIETLCVGSDVELKYAVNQGPFSAVQTVEWTGPNGFYSTEKRPIISDLQTDNAGMYILKAYGGPGCFDTDTTEIIVSDQQVDVLNIDLTPPSGCFTNDGEMTITMTEPGNYNLTSSPSGLYDLGSSNPFDVGGQIKPNDYTLRITKTGLDCEIHEWVTVPSPYQPIINTTDETCIGGDGTAEVITSIPPEKVTWITPGGIWQDNLYGEYVDGLSAGVYNVIVEDSITHCNHYEDAIINPYLHFEAMVIDTPDCDVANGTMEIVEYGNATLPITYNWSNGMSGSILSNLEYGDYSVTMTDGDGCQRHQNFYLPPRNPCFSFITGNVYLNHDCICVADTNDYPVSKVRICAEMGDYKDCYYTDNTGYYQIIAFEPGDYTITATQSNNYAQEICVAQTVTVPQGFTDVNDVDLFYCSSPLTDYAVSAYCGPARPGFVQNYSFKVTNVGTITNDTAFIYADLDDDLEIDQISPSPITFDMATNEISWILRRLEINEVQKLRVKAKVPVDAVLGDTIFTNVEMTTLNQDVFLDNNESFCETLITGSFDPNDKLVNPIGGGTSGEISDADSLFTYTIRFQNTGTDTAFTIVVRDTLDADVFDLNSVQPLNSSHPYRLDVEGENILVFLFEDINLPDSNRTVEGSQGYVMFQLAIKQDLPPGTLIQNNAAIYFDFNEPIITNTTINTITHLAENALPKPSLSVNPNPTSGYALVELHLPLATKQLQLDLYSIEGMFIGTIHQSSNVGYGVYSIPLDVQDLGTGMYLLHLKTEQGTVVQKFMNIK